jgi:hypothetical protein
MVINWRLTGSLKSVIEGGTNKLLGMSVADIEANYLSGKSIFNRRKINKAALKMNIGKISDPDDIWSDRTEIFD